MVQHKKLIASFGFAFEGLLHSFQRDQNFRVHLIIAVLIIAAGLFFNLSVLEMAVVIGAITIVFIAELANTAVEQIIDFIVSEHVQEAKRIKDVAAAMVLISAIGSVIIGALIFVPKIFTFLTK